MKAWLTARLRGVALQLAGRDRMQYLAQFRAALCAEDRLEPGLGFDPAFDGGPEALGSGLGQPDFPAAAVAASGDDRDEPLALERLEIAAERCTIHDKIRGECADRHRPEAAQPGQDRELRRAQPRRAEKLIIELGHVPGSLAQRQTITQLRL